jgi:hypothetical protein
VIRGSRRGVEVVQERWRIDEGWWTPEPASRIYYRLVLTTGGLVTVYRDLFDDTWWMQRA